VPAVNVGVDGSALSIYWMSSFGVVAQSIGGGGGIGAIAIAHGGHEYGRAILTGSFAVPAAPSV
jgi:hypothetical protein